jgi:hypothetical protein
MQTLFPAMWVGYRAPQCDVCPYRGRMPSETPVPAPEPPWPEPDSEPEPTPKPN